MAMSANGHSHSGDPPERRQRFDTAAHDELEGTYSGRRFVITAVLTVLTAWGVLYLVFHKWRTGVLARAAFGAREVAPTVDPLAQLVPEGVSPADWRNAVAQTHSLLVTLTAANLLDKPQMERLRAELTARVAAARPETSRTVLRSIWDDLCARAGPVLIRRPRPKVLDEQPTPPLAKPTARATPPAQP